MNFQILELEMTWRPLDAGNSAEWDSTGWYPVPEQDLPVKLPYVENYRPTGTGESPLAQDKDWVKVACPECGQAARRETDVSDTFLDSSWYFLRYPSLESQKSKVKSQNDNSAVKNGKSDLPWDQNITRRWLPVNMYIGGAEHSVLHLMYSRFVTMALYDWGYLHFEEPFSCFWAHGLLIKEGVKMSKSKGNVIVPDEYIKKYGVDTLRAYLMFLSPFDMGGDFRDTGMEGMHKFLRRVWDLVISTRKLVLVEEESARRVLSVIHKTIKRVTQDLENLRYNRALAGMMEYVNFLKEISAQYTVDSTQDKKGNRAIICAEWEEAIKTLLLLLAPFAPHMTEELWQQTQVSGVDQLSDSQSAGRFTDKRKAGKLRTDNLQLRTDNWSIHFQAWPAYDEDLTREEMVEIPVQVNGKLRATISVDQQSVGDQTIVEAKARQNSSVQNHLQGRKIKKVVFIPGRTVNFVV